MAEFGVKPPPQVNTNSKWVYSKAALAGQSPAIILRVASELDLLPELGVTNEQLITENDRPPRNWEGSVSFRLFISHVSVDNLKATRLKECLVPYSISGFVAHEDIAPTLEWQGEIERGLRTMDALLAIHTPGFSKSNWCQQEVGYALGRGVKIISLKLGEDPTGFIGKHQALARRDRVAEEIAKEVDAILSSDSRTRDSLAQAKGRFPERLSVARDSA
ncbi:toll/interleukin-1 receptor domain-containing protein [Rhizobium glycinendophyticum]|uniref:toll/interleukin-1 receptor domain-containing protein n=1 Tax=Rhizobium glycinendophyticum TaxID=2589807 RepID=UPI0013764270|nr:toll/interleukin-1 receptor domain-containing protein [Rhizobium glycinendophyticum]